jgi:hypothetical protein
MYISISEAVGIMIALGACIFLILITTLANYELQKQNRFLRSRLRAWRKHCQNHVEVPF